MKKILLLLFIITFTSAYSQSINVTEADSEIIHEIFNANWQHADSLIDIQLQLKPNHPKYYFMKAYNAYYCRFMTRRGLARDVSIRKVIDNTWRGIQIGEAMPQTTEVKFYLGNCYAFLSRANIMKHQYWLGYWNAGKSEDYYEDVLEEDPNITDAYLNLGVMDYFPDAMLEGFKYFMAWLGGAGGDKQTGINYITRVADNGSLFKEEAKVALGFIYWLGEHDNEKSLTYFSELHDKYPNADFLAYFYNRMNFVTIVMNKGVDFITAESDSLKTKYGINEPTILPAAGYALFDADRTSDARVAFEENIKQFPDAYYPYRALGDYYDMMEDERNAVKYLKLSMQYLDRDTNYTQPVKERVKAMMIDILKEHGVEANEI